MSNKIANRTNRRSQVVIHPFSPEPVGLAWRWACGLLTLSAMVGLYAAIGLAQGPYLVPLPSDVREMWS